MPLLRSVKANVYHFCERCNVRWPLSRMKWQQGKLLCIPNGCVDAAILGSRDLAVAKQVSIDRHELEPDPKLTNPSEQKVDQLDILF